MDDNKPKRDFKPDIIISGPGAISVSSSDVLRTNEARRQIKALEELVSKKAFSK